MEEPEVVGLLSDFCFYESLSVSHRGILPSVVLNLVRPAWTSRDTEQTPSVSHLDLGREVGRGGSGPGLGVSGSPSARWNDN